jgi:hypothetical protein
MPEGPRVSSASFSLRVLSRRRLDAQIEDDVFDIPRSSSHYHLVAMCFLGSTEALHMMGEVLAYIAGPLYRCFGTSSSHYRCQ